MKIFNCIVFQAKWCATNKKPIRLATQVMDEIGFVKQKTYCWLLVAEPHANTITSPHDCDQVFYVDDLMEHDC
jgi:hypothetical protein